MIWGEIRNHNLMEAEVVVAGLALLAWTFFIRNHAFLAWTAYIHSQLMYNDDIWGYLMYFLVCYINTF